jgi:hypothetical protein
MIAIKEQNDLIINGFLVNGCLFSSYLFSGYLTTGYLVIEEKLSGRQQTPKQILYNHAAIPGRCICQFFAERGFLFAGW